MWQPYLFLLLLSCIACGPKALVSEPIGTTDIAANTAPDSSILDYRPDPYSSLVELQTRYGNLKLEIYCDVPQHRENFMKLVKKGFYDSLAFHRIVEHFMIQGGDPNTRPDTTVAAQQFGTGGPGYTLPAEISPRFVHYKGALAAARMPDGQNPAKNSSGSQFYIVDGRAVKPEQLDKNERKYEMVYTAEQRAWYAQHGGAPQLDMEYTVFGRVYEGLDIIDSLAQVPTNAIGRPKEALRMQMRIIRE